MLVKVSGELLLNADNSIKMQARLDLLKTAWNMATESGAKRKRELTCFISKQKKYAPGVSRVLLQRVLEFDRGGFHFARDQMGLCLVWHLLLIHAARVQG